MAATQQILFAETIAGMKKAFKRKAYESDSDSEIEHYGNRGNKLKKKARLAHRGQLVSADGAGSFKETVEYGGVRRSIIHRNAPLVDEEGFEIDSDDDDDRIEEAMASAAELDPYGNIVLENVLAPLTASTDLPTHSTLSKPFTSQNLTDLVFQSATMLRRENTSLWKVKHLWTGLCGDHTWVPCQSMMGPHDSELFTEDLVARHLSSISKSKKPENSRDSSPATVAGDAQNNNHSDPSSNPAGPSGETEPAVANSNETGDVSMADAKPGDADTTESNDTEDAKSKRKRSHSKASQSLPNGGEADISEKETTNTANQEEQHNGTTKPDDPGNTVPATDDFIHPMFVYPSVAKPDRDLGLPEQEAEDMRRLLALYVQKQEEVCRGVKKLHDGVYKAQRLRREVLHWSKAEAHCGPNRDLSDGEDWYDKEEWGLTEDLKKGQDDEEEDTTTTTKKTRNRK